MQKKLQLCTMQKRGCHALRYTYLIYSIPVRITLPPLSQNTCTRCTLSNKENTSSKYRTKTSNYKNASLYTNRKKFVLSKLTKKPQWSYYLFLFSHFFYLWKEHNILIEQGQIVYRDEVIYKKGKIQDKQKNG